MSDLQAAIQHREQGEYKQAEHILKALLTQSTDDPTYNYHMAWLCDVQGYEQDAVPYYEHAIQHGLAGTDLQRGLLGLGSTYRALGRYDDAAKTLRKGVDMFPDAREFAVFLAIALHNLGQHDEAMGLLLRQLAETSEDKGIQRFKRAILFYHDKLDETWT